MFFLSVCIPTYNRAEHLNKTLESITSQAIFRETSDIEIVISNNASTDETDTVCQKYINMYPDKINYIKHSTALSADENIMYVIKQGKGNYVKFNNDTNIFRLNSLESMINDLKYADSENADAVFFANGHAKKTNLTESFDDFLLNVIHISTWIGAHTYKKDFLNSLDNVNRCCNLKLNQVDLIGRLYEKNSKVYVVNNIYFNSIQLKGKGGYNIAEVFGKNYLDILRKYASKKILSYRTIEKTKKELLKFINSYYFNNEHYFYKNGYFKYLLKYYFYNIYFYSLYLKAKRRYYAL